MKSRNVRSGPVAVESSDNGNLIGARSSSKRDLGEKTDRIENLRSRYNANRILRRNATMGNKENYEPPTLNGVDQGNHEQLDPEYGMTWRDV